MANISVNQLGDIVNAIINGVIRDLKTMNSKKLNDWLNTLPKRIKTAPKDEQAAYFAILGGICLIIIEIFIWILLRK
jgi:hypothetical protein